MIGRHFVLRYHEIALKGGNRNWFEERLALNVKKMVQRVLGRDASVNTAREYGRVLLTVMCPDYSTTHEQAVYEAVSRTFGIASFSPITIVPTDLTELTRTALAEVRGIIHEKGMPGSFRVLTRRSDKALPQKSIEIDREIGGTIKTEFPGMSVDLENPALTVGIEVRFKHSFVWTSKHPGPGGLPVGTNARLLALLSGGIDSPVAAILSSRRGSPVSFIHFHGAPFIGSEIIDKVTELRNIINRYQPESEPLYIVPFGKIQEKIAAVTGPRMRTVLYRRLMVRISSELAKRISALALVTGEGLGQVASQTVENIATIDSAAAIPILRPLITYDKDEIIKKAKVFGTYECSIKPAADCCTLFTERHPILYSTPDHAATEELKFDTAGYVMDALSGLMVI
ncbi:MAG: tRNA uracil 4-sulfurtransferase ThiI [Bdellovibrionota bacterium]